MDSPQARASASFARAWASRSFLAIDGVTKHHRRNFVVPRRAFSSVS